MHHFNNNNYNTQNTHMHHKKKKEVEEESRNPGKRRVLCTLPEQKQKLDTGGWRQGHRRGAEAGVVTRIFVVPSEGSKPLECRKRTKEEQDQRPDAGKSQLLENASPCNNSRNW